MLQEIVMKFMSNLCCFQKFETAELLTEIQMRNILGRDGRMLGNFYCTVPWIMRFRF
jgi:hypothetical protein